MRPVRLAVFASGAGSNLQAILDAGQRIADWPAEVALVVSDRPQSRAVARARETGVDVAAFAPKSFDSKAAYEAAVLAELRAHDVEWIALAGYMRIVGDTLLDAYEGRILNIHPSLLPAFPGKSGIADAFEAGVAETGVTVHLVDRGVDTGPIIAQWHVPIAPGMSLKALESEIHEVEHHLYPMVLAHLLAAWRERD